jgi:hypothetical protein
MIDKKQYEIIVHKNGLFYAVYIFQHKTGATRFFNRLVGSSTEGQSKLLEDHDYITGETIYSFVIIPAEAEEEKDYAPKELKWYDKY